LSTHVVDLMSGLRREGHQVRLVHGGMATPPRSLRLVRAALARGNRDRYGAWHTRAALSLLRERVEQQLKAMAPDVLHCHDPLAGAAVASAVGGTSRPVIETVHGPALYEYRQTAGVGGRPRIEDIILQCERSAFAAATHLIAVDSGQADILRKDYGVPTHRITVIFNSVNVAEVRALANRDTPFALPTPFFLVPRRLVPKTGVRFAIEALARMACPSAHLVIAGDGSLRQELETQTAKLRLSERVHFLGSVPRSQLLPLFARAVGVLIPSVPATGVVEATSLAVMEAMANGSVAIASGIGGLAELIQDDVTGLLVATGDSAALAHAMTRILEDLPLRTRLIAAATDKVERDYSTQAWLARVLGVYEQALTNRRSAVRSPSGAP
jgi:glycosyltransferase involved in cell wall biosynthesis